MISKHINKREPQNNTQTAFALAGSKAVSLQNNRPRFVVQQKQKQSPVVPTVLQAVWVAGEHGVSKWDQPIDGVTWYSDREDMMWFEITHPDLVVEGKLEQYKQLEGPAHKQPYKFWLENHLFHLRSRIEGIAHRIGNYRTARKEKHITREIGDTRRIAGGKYVQDDFNHDEAPIDDKPFHTHFLNHYSTKEAYMDENYRHKDIGKHFFASDVFLDQYTAAIHQKDITEGQPIAQIPARMPAKITRATISNEQTKATLLSIFGSEIKNYVVRPGDRHYQDLIKTPNGAATINILSEYNAINRIRSGEIFQVDCIQVKKTSADGGWFMEFHFKAV